jgi:hypothetical protein
LTGNTPGPLNSDAYVPFTAPTINATGAGGGDVFVVDSLDTNFTPDKAPQPVNLTAMNQTVPALVPIPTGTSPGGGSGDGSSGSGSDDNAADATMANLRVAVMACFVAIVMGGYVALA